MSKRVHFEDNIFFLNIMTRTIRDGLLLDLDPNMYLARLTDEIGFIDDSLYRILDELIRNDRMIERYEQLCNMAECEANFQAVLSQCRSGETALAQSWRSQHERLSHWQERSKLRMAKLDDLTHDHRSSDDDEALVSTYELKELLKGGTEA